MPNPLIKLPIGAITPRSWLRTQLERMRDGFVGHLPELTPFCRDDSGWMRPNRRGWEELPYWLRGYGGLGYALKDERFVAEAKRWLDAVIAGQDADGWFGPRANKLARDRFNGMTFEPVETMALKLEVQLQPGYSAGIFEWVAGPLEPF